MKKPWDKASLLTVVVLLLCGLCGRISAYNPSAFTNYSDTYARTPNHDMGQPWDWCTPYTWLDQHEGDCTNFTSQCLIAGSAPSGCGLKYCGATIRAPDLFNCLRYTMCWRWQKTTWDQQNAPDWLGPGDVIIFGDTGGGVEVAKHSVQVVLGQGADSYINAHSSTRYHESWINPFQFFDWCYFFEYRQPPLPCGSPE